MTDTLHGYKILRSGDLSLLYRAGEIRQVCLGGVQVLNAIYAAVRDQNWTTIPFTVNQENIEVNPEGFTIEAVLHYSLEKIQYSSRISIEAKGNQLEVKYKGVAESSFLRNRIGLCILHPIKESRGKQVIITHPDATHSQGRFPEMISPDQPFFNISGMRWNPAKGITGELSFEGEIFESEDQRNWTDASYKTYCTPLELVFPVQVLKGEVVHQSISLVVKQKAGSGQVSASRTPISSLPEKRILTILPGKIHPLPALGVGRSVEAKPMTQEEAEILSALPLNHYRVDLQLDKHGWKDVYDSAASEQNLLGWPLELALHFANHPKQELDVFLKHYNLHRVKIWHVLVFDQDFLSGSELLRKVAPQLNAAFPGTAVGGGTDTNFAELNRNRPDPQLLDFITYSICPQIHAFDNLTLVENLEAQPDSVSSVKCLLSKPVSIGAITLKQRFNAVATDNKVGQQDSPESDPRQHTNFAAAWTMISIRNLALAGAASITYYETVGPRGILSRQDSPLTRSPLYHIFKEILSGKQMQVLPTKSSHPLEFDCLALTGLKENRILIANYTVNELSIEISGLPVTPLHIFQLKDEGWMPYERMNPGDYNLALKPTGIYKICHPV